MGDAACAELEDVVVFVAAGGDGKLRRRRSAPRPDDVLNTSTWAYDMPSNTRFRIYAMITVV